MAPQVTHNTNLGGKTIQAYAIPFSAGQVALDFNNMDVRAYQEWTIEEARGIARLLTLAAADAELES